MILICVHALVILAAVCSCAAAQLWDDSAEAEAARLAGPVPLRDEANVDLDGQAAATGTWTKDAAETEALSPPTADGRPEQPTLRQVLESMKVRPAVRRAALTRRPDRWAGALPRKFNVYVAGQHRLGPAALLECRGGILQLLRAPSRLSQTGRLTGQRSDMVLVRNGLNI